MVTLIDKYRAPCKILWLIHCTMLFPSFILEGVTTVQFCEGDEMGVDQAQFSLVKYVVNVFKSSIFVLNQTNV